MALSRALKNVMRAKLKPGAGKKEAAPKASNAKTFQDTKVKIGGPNYSQRETGGKPIGKL